MTRSFSAGQGLIGQKEPEGPPHLSPCLLPAQFHPRTDSQSSCLCASWLRAPPEGSRICPSSTLSAPPAVALAWWLGSSGEDESQGNPCSLPADCIRTLGHACPLQGTGDMQHLAVLPRNMAGRVSLPLTFVVVVLFWL